MAEEMGAFTLRRLQEEQREWQRQNFPDNRPWQAILGLSEEVGEISHAYLKASQGIRGSEQEHRVDMMDGVGDVAIFLAEFCNLMGFDLETVVERVWSEVKQRNWKANPNGTGYGKGKRYG